MAIDLQPHNPENSQVDFSILEILQKSSPARKKEIESRKKEIESRKRVGQKKRQRAENDSFSSHPFKPNKNPNYIEEQDEKPGYPPAGPSPFLNMDSDLSDQEEVQVNEKNHKAGPHNLTRNDRKLRQHVRRYSCDEPLLKDFEYEIRNFIKKCIYKEDEYELDMDISDVEMNSNNSEEWVSLTNATVVDGEELHLKITNSFLRLLVHSMCYNKGDDRITVIKAPDEQFEFPNVSFTDYFLH
ncbi:hypothetical protein HDV06_001795 [Boothiomyces sp. JEL0866]|nr:hypothetical protein HDV06_001795 [Boothiomyces sp. JEL0866]